MVRRRPGLHEGYSNPGYVKQAQGAVGTRAGLAYGAGLGLHHIEPTLPGFGYEATLKHHGDGLLADVDHGDVVNGVVVRDGDGAAVGLELGATTWSTPRWRRRCFRSRACCCHSCSC